METKMCRGCGQLLPKTDEFFYAHFNKKRGKVVFCSLCRECRSKYGKAYHAANKERHNEQARERAKKYYREHKDTIIEQMKEYRSRDPEKWREMHKQNQRERCSRIKQLPASFTDNDWKDALTEFSCSCAYCGKGGKITKDHLVPVAKGGGYTKGNILPACFSCNRSKYDRDFEEWYREQPFFDKEREEHIQAYIAKEKAL